MIVPTAFETFCAETRPALLAFLYLQTGNRDIAEDLAEEVLIRACERWATVADMHDPRAWAFKVAHNLSRSRWRRLHAEQRARVRHGPQAVVQAAHPTAEVVAVRDALADLPARQRAVLVLRYMLGFPAADCGAILGLSDSGVRTLTARAAERLRGRLATFEHSEERLP